MLLAQLVESSSPAAPRITAHLPERANDLRVPIGCHLEFQVFLLANAAMIGEESAYAAEPEVREGPRSPEGVVLDELGIPDTDSAGAVGIADLLGVARNA